MENYTKQGELMCSPNILNSSNVVYAYRILDNNTEYIGSTRKTLLARLGNEDSQKRINGKNIQLKIILQLPTITSEKELRKAEMFYIFKRALELNNGVIPQVPQSILKLPNVRRILLNQNFDYLNLIWSGLQIEYAKQMGDRNFQLLKPFPFPYDSNTFKF